MKRFLMLAAVVGGLGLFGLSGNAHAHSGGHGGGHGHGHRHGHHHHHGHFHGGHGGGFGGYRYSSPGFYIGTPSFQFGYGNAFVPSYSRFGYYSDYGYGGGCGW